MLLPCCEGTRTARTTTLLIACPLVHLPLNLWSNKIDIVHLDLLIGAAQVPQRPDRSAVINPLPPVSLGEEGESLDGSVHVAVEAHETLRP